MHIIVNGGDGKIDSHYSNFTRTSATLQYSETYQITRTITRRIYFEADGPTEDAITIMATSGFPQYGEQHPYNTGYNYYGNGTIAPLSDGSKIWCAELEYSDAPPEQTSSSSSSSNRTHDTDPTDMLPNVSFTYPEIQVPFEYAYNSHDDDNEANTPVVNSAGDPFSETTTVRIMQMNISFATKSWDVGDALDYGCTINRNSITICGLSIPAQSALLLPPEASYTTEYNDSGSTKWSYYEVNCSIQIVPEQLRDLVLRRKLLDVGNRAYFKSISLNDDKMLSDANVSATLPACENYPSQICHFRLHSSIGGSIVGYAPTGDVIFCGWEQYLAARQIYWEASVELVKNGKMSSYYELQCEQDTKMPLDGSGYLDEDALKNGEKYNTITFDVYPTMSWSGLNLPSNGLGSSGRKYTSII